ncbi:MAG TPA: ADP-ribosyl-[dinitrogen reductase] hydrolase [Geobacteraceae bacterium]|nr:ADP-ribosyl-[dinitrogen reductase] hydrolase [Geobacteraceae bacterium]
MNGGLRPNRDELLDRSRAVLLGVAAGDALGAPLEFMTPGEIAAKHGRLNEMVGGGWLRLRPGQVTDDTEMTLCLARAVAKAGGWDLAGIATEFATWLKSKPVDVGDTCRRGIRNFMLKGELETPFNEWDAGNGALMRMGGVTLFTLGSDELLRSCAIQQAHLTHNHPVSDAACITYGNMVHLALLGASRNRLRREADQLVADFPTFRFDPYPGLATGYVVDTMQTVLHHFFRSRSFEECIVSIANQGGDADTTAAIAGGLAGAYYGLGEIPKKWMKKLEKRYATELSELAVKLVSLSPLLEGICHGS